MSDHALAPGCKKRPPKPEKLDHLSREDFLVSRINQLSALITTAQGSAQAWTALTALTRQLDQAHAELSRLRESKTTVKEEDLAHLPPAEQERILRAEFRGCPDAVLWWAIEELQVRYPGKIRVLKEEAA